MKKTGSVLLAYGLHKKMSVFKTCLFKESAMNPLRHCCLLSIWVCLGSWCTAAEFRVTETGFAQHEKTGIRVVSGILELPAEGYWFVPNPFGLEGDITQIFLNPPHG